MFWESRGAKMNIKLSSTENEKHIRTVDSKTRFSDRLTDRHTDRLKQRKTYILLLLKGEITLKMVVIILVTCLAVQSFNK